MAKLNNNLAPALKLAALALTLIGMIVAGSIVLGQQNQKINTNEKRVQQNEKVVRQLEKGQATILERTRQTREISQENKDALKEVLKELRRQR